MRLLPLLALAALLPARPVLAAVSCASPTRTPAAITAASPAGLKCQATLAKEASRYLSTRVKVLSDCKLASAPGTCPTPADADTLQKLIAKVQGKIGKACGDTGRAGLSSSYRAGVDAGVLASCLLSQHGVVADLLSAETTGASTQAWPNTGAERATCVKEVSAAAAQLVASLTRNASACLNARAKKKATGNLAPACVGAYSGGSFVPPTDRKTAGKQQKAFAKVGARIAKKCGPAAAKGHIASMFGCAGAETVSDLQACLACNGFTALADAMSQQYGETGTYVANAPGALQAAVDAAAAGSRLLIGSGDYVEEVLIQTDGLALVGCGAASNDRPRIVAPNPQTAGRGIRAFGVDGLLFQSLETFEQTNDGIFIAQAEGVTFRDIVGDGNNVSRYIVFPVRSNNVVIELCAVQRTADAPLYVGQSTNVIVRHNDVRTSVAGIEFENCANGRGYNNYAFDNTGALLVFKDPGLDVQYSECHEIDHNFFDSNNRPNFGTGTVGAVPTGTGILVVANDRSAFHHNVARNNNTFGFLAIDQSPFDPPGTPERPDANFIFANIFENNGLSPDPRYGIGADAAALNVGTDNCQVDNVVGTPLAFAELPPCALPVAAFPGCPAPPVPPAP